MIAGPFGGSVYRKYFDADEGGWSDSDAGGRLENCGKFFEKEVFLPDGTQDWESYDRKYQSIKESVKEEGKL